MMSKAVISRSAIRHNHSLLKERAGGVKTMCVVKADAYGHGAVETALCLADATEWFAVAHIREAVELREHGIRNPILVFAPPLKEEVHLYPLHEITAVVSSVRHLALLKAGTSFHLHVDTGMNRTGIRPDECPEFDRALARRADLAFDGVMTHFATAECADPTHFNRQLLRFVPVVEKYGPGRVVHAANSGTILLKSTARFDAVRPGIALYGIDPAGIQGNDLRPALEWTSFLIEVNRIRKGEPVSYGATWTAPGDGYYGVVPVGYRDGLMRALSGRIRFTVEGRPVPQVGVITMDASMVWMADDPAAVGTEVTLYGSDAVSLREWAGLLGTISYELLCALGSRVERVYVD